MTAHRNLLAAALLIAGATNAGAGEAVDPQYGLRVVLPDGFVAEPYASPDYDAAFRITSATGLPEIPVGEPALCEIGYDDRPGNRDFTRQQFSELMDQPDYVAQVQQVYVDTFGVGAPQRFTLEGAVGIEMTGETATDAVFVSMVETETGATQIVCVTAAADVAGAMTLFRTFRDGMGLPR